MVRDRRDHKAKAIVIAVMTLLLLGSTLLVVGGRGQGSDPEGVPTACTNGQDDDGDGLVDWPDDPGCDDADDDSERVIPGTPQEVSADPGPGTGRITVRWMGVPDATAYLIHRPGGGGPIGEVPGEAARGEPPAQNSFIVEQDVAFDVMGIVAPGGSGTFQVTARNEEGDSAPSEQVSATVFLACTPFEVCATFHPTERLFAVQERPPGGGEGPTVMLELAELHIAAGGEDARQKVLVARPEGTPDPREAFEGLPGGPISITYTATPFDLTGSDRLVLSAEPSDDVVVLASVWKGRLWVYLGDVRVTDVPFTLALPFASGDCDDADPDCHRTPGAGLAAVLSVVLSVLALARWRRRGEA